MWPPDGVGPTPASGQLGLTDIRYSGRGRGARKRCRRLIEPRAASPSRHPESTHEPARLDATLVAPGGDAVRRARAGACRPPARHPGGRRRDCRGAPARADDPGTHLSGDVYVALSADRSSHERPGGDRAGRHALLHRDHRARHQRRRIPPDRPQGALGRHHRHALPARARIPDVLRLPDRDRRDAERPVCDGAVHGIDPVALGQPRDRPDPHGHGTVQE